MTEYKNPKLKSDDIEIKYCCVCDMYTIHTVKNDKCLSCGDFE